MNTTKLRCVECGLTEPLDTPNPVFSGPEPLEKKLVDHEKAFGHKGYWIDTERT